MLLGLLIVSALSLIIFFSSIFEPEKGYASPDGETCVPPNWKESLSGFQPFATKAETIETVASKNNMDPVLLAAVLLHETDGGKHMKDFPNLDKAIEETAAKFKGKKDFKGANTQITDPFQREKWEKGVATYVSYLGGLYNSNCTAFYSPLKSPLRVTSPMQRFRVSTGRPHFGTDYQCAPGEEIHAIKDGTVTKVAFEPRGYGHYVEIEHGKITSLYAHLQKVSESVKVGQYVQGDQVIGSCGNTGFVISGRKGGGFHLHLEIFDTGKKRNFAHHYTLKDFQE